jgi:hypothetical protein
MPRTKGERRKQRDQWAAKTLRDLRIAEIAQLVGAILDGKVEAYPARVATARFGPSGQRGTGSNHDRSRPRLRSM